MNAGDVVYVYPSHGIAEADKLDGKKGRVLKDDGVRLAVELVNGDPRTIYCRSPDGVLYLYHGEVSEAKR